MGRYASHPAARRFAAVGVCLVVAVPLAAAPAVTDESTQRAVDRAVAWLYSQQDRQGFFPNPHSREYVGGGEALVALALLRAGESPENFRLRKTLEALKTVPAGHTYTRALRIMAYSHLPGAAFRRQLGADVQWLAKYQVKSGGWGYGPGSLMTRQRPEWTDASNSQLAVLALREACDAGILTAAGPLGRAQRYWGSFQNPDGGWGYQPAIAGRPPQRGASHGSMTAAALASYLIFADRQGPYSPGRKRRKAPTTPFADRMDKALKWLGENYRIEKVPRFVWVAQPSQLGYYRFCLQRVGDSAGLWDIAGHDYCAEVSSAMLASQKTDGSWNGSVIDTAFAILTLVKARAPVVIGRLDPGRQADRFPREGENLARHLSRRLGRTLAWRQVRADQPERLGRARLLFCHAPPAGSPEDPAPGPVVDYVRNGGTLVIQAGSASDVEPLVERIAKPFGDYTAAALGPDHPAWSLRFPIDSANRPAITGIGDRCRTRIFVLADNVSDAWRQGRAREHPHLFDLAANLVLYSVGGRLPAGKFSQSAPPAEPPEGKRHIDVARLKYKGDYNVCPLAIRRLSRRLAHSLPVGLNVLPAVDPGRPIKAGIPVVWLTGNVPPRLSDAEKSNLRDYLTSGGTLLIDPAIGRSDFHDAALALADDLCGKANVAPLKPDHPLITGSFADGVGANLARLAAPPATQPATAPATAPAPPGLVGGAVNGRIAVVVSRYGLTCSIEGTPCVENAGYASDDAAKVALNVILHAVAGRAE
ncbi:MAG: DUF4159 domain-containing protein [Planctomycetota bacterium]|jgi:hypothetical protein